MDKIVVKIAAELLRIASGVFDTFPCNDYEIPNTPENRAFAEAFEEELNISDDGETIYLTDWVVMDYCADILEKMEV